MNFRDVDRAPMHALNEIIWKSIDTVASYAAAGTPFPSPH